MSRFPRALAITVSTLLAVTCAVHPAREAAAATVYVSPSGDDANAGTSPDQPVRTLHRARDVVRLLNADLTGDLRVELADGV